MPLPIALGAALMIGARVAVAFTARMAVRAAVPILVRGVGGLVIRTGARIAVRSAGRLVVTIFRSGFARLGMSAFGALRSVGLLTAGLMLAQLGMGLLANIWSAAISTTHFILNFNLNVTDAELDAQLLASIQGFYGLLGGAVGSATGYLVCGAIPGSLSFAFNPGVAAALMKDLDDEARSEVLGHVNMIARRAFQTLINAELMNKFKSTRRFLKKNPDNKFARFMKKILGEENFKKWGDSNRPSFTIAEDVIKKRIERIPDKGTKDFLENALEEFGDTCMESGYIVANNFDSHLAAYSLMQRQVLGNPVEVSIVFDDDDNDVDSNGNPTPRRNSNSNRQPERRSTNRS